MALSNKEVMSYGKFGAVAGIATGFILKFISGIVSMIPGVELDLQSISLGTTGLGGVVRTDLSVYAAKLLGAIPGSFTLPEWAMLAIGGAAFVILGAYVADFLKLLNGEKKAQLTTVLVIAGIVTGWILSMNIEIPTLTAIIVMVVDAFVLSWILIGVNKQLPNNMKFVP